MLTRIVAVCRSEVFSTRKQLISHYGTTKVEKQIKTTAQQNHGVPGLKLMQQHCSNVLKHDTPRTISRGLCFGASQHTFGIVRRDDDLSMVLDDKRNARLPRGLL